MKVLFVTSGSWPIAIIRVVLGIIFFAHGAQKVFGRFGGYGLKRTTGYLRSIGIPLPIAYVSGQWLSRHGGRRISCACC